MSDSDIITRCPQCNTAFRVTPNQLAVADGVVRCGSCLAVFKAIHENSHSTPAITTKPTPEKSASLLEPGAEENDELINDEDSIGLTLENDIYDIETTPNKESKTSLFDRKLKPDTYRHRENADESWALDMLADIEDDDDIQPLHIKRKIQQSPLSEIGESQAIPEHKPQQQKEIKNTPIQSTPPKSITKPRAEPRISNDMDIEPLFFEHDIVADEHYAPAVPSTKTSRKTDRDDDMAFTEISDDEIENAIQGRTSYASDPKKGYLSGIEPAPVEMEWFESENTQRWLWISGAILAGLLVIIQVAIFRFDILSKQPSYRPYYQSACHLLGCKLPSLLDTAKIRTTNLVVRTHPSEQNALIIDAILINNAVFEQPYPALRLEFTDLNDQLIASRNLQPNDYLRGELAGAKQMPVNQPIQLSLAIVDPGETAVNYRLTVVDARQP
jgi:predicted Zn finger-like uncharacterized protein